MNRVKKYYKAVSVHAGTAYGRVELHMCEILT